MPMPNRTSTGNYRYAYQGQEKDPETGKEAFELRLWDSRIGRWLTTDPKRQFYSPYLGMRNNPIRTIDKDGAVGEDYVQDNVTNNVIWTEATGDAALVEAAQVFGHDDVTNLSADFFVDPNSFLDMGLSGLFASDQIRGIQTDYILMYLQG